MHLEKYMRNLYSGMPDGRAFDAAIKEQMEEDRLADEYYRRLEWAREQETDAAESETSPQKGKE